MEQGLRSVCRKGNGDSYKNHSLFWTVFNSIITLNMCTMTGKIQVVQNSADILTEGIQFPRLKGGNL